MTSEDVEISGYHIPAKVGSFFFLPILYLAMGITLQTQVVHLTYTVCRDPKYVEDPITFKPERRESPTNEEMDAFLSLPFGFGPRSCYGDV